MESLVKYPELKTIYDTFSSKLQGSIIETSFDKDELTIKVRKEEIADIIKYFNNELKFNALNDIIALDNLNTRKENEKRFSILYQLYKFPEALRIRIRIDLDENEIVESITSIFNAANWAEREIFDMYGIKFSNHPDLKRIYMQDDYKDYPLRKDFPLAP